MCTYIHSHTHLQRDGKISSEGKDKSETEIATADGRCRVSIDKNRGVFVVNDKQASPNEVFRSVSDSAIGDGPFRLKLMDDGSLAMINKVDKVIWTRGKGAMKAVITDDCNFKLTAPGNACIWDTKDSCGPKPVPDKNPGWVVKVYKGPKGMDSVPRIKGLMLIGEGKTDKINIVDHNGFRKLVSDTPNDNFVWVTSGTLRVATAGKYKVCTKSDDGSFLYMDGEEVVDNDGLHGPEQKCSEIDLSAGRHMVTGTGFQRGGGAHMEITYRSVFIEY
jgi:hypothetical protein